MSTDAWSTYDYDSLPELSDEQLGSLRPVTAAEHRRFRDGTMRPVGRPKKAPGEKEKLVSMRFAPRLIAALKAKAKACGISGWQTYAKQILREHLAKA